MPASISISHFEKLKKELLKKAGITTVSANDCKLLSLTISKNTGGSVSETTIKRIYRFAISRFFPSMYTLNQMALCCGYASWEEFSNHESAIQSTVNNHELLKFRKDAENITDFTIRALQNKSGIPYSYTVSRKSINEQIDHFSSSNSTCALISAPAGRGCARHRRRRPMPAKAAARRQGRRRPAPAGWLVACCCESHQPACRAVCKSRCRCRSWYQ